MTTRSMGGTRPAPLVCIMCDAYGPEVALRNPTVERDGKRLERLPQAEPLCPKCCDDLSLVRT